MLRPIIRWWSFQRMRWNRFWSSLTFGRLARRVSSFIGTLWYIIKYPFYLLGRLVVSLWNGMRSAWTQQYVRYFLQGLPALAAILGIGITSAFAYLRGGEGLIDFYNREGQAAFNGGQHERARLCFERLSELSPRDPEARYFLALSLQRTGGLESQNYAQTVLNDLAPLDSGNGYPPAHLSSALYMLQKSTPTAETLQTAEKHLRRALNPAAVPPLKESEARQARLVLGRVLQYQRRDDEAEPYLVASAAYSPDIRIELSKLYRRKNRPDLAREQARAAAAYFEGISKQDLDNVSARILWASALVELEEFKQAVEVLQAGEAMKSDVRYRTMISEAYRVWATNIRLRDPQKLDEYLGYLQQAILARPDNPNAIGLLVDLTRSQTPEAIKAKQRLRELLAQNGKSPLLHFAVGVVAYEEDPNSPVARFHWKQAFDLDYDMAIAANNLAWHLATVQPLDLPQALKIATAVAEKNPNVGIFHGTRGYILYLMGNFQEAIPALEKSLDENKAMPDINKTLADCYAAIGNKAMAEEHQKQFNFKLRAIQEDVQRGGKQ